MTSAKKDNTHTFIVEIRADSVHTSETGALIFEREEEKVAEVNGTIMVLKPVPGSALDLIRKGLEQES